MEEIFNPVKWADFVVPKSHGGYGDLYFFYDNEGKCAYIGQTSNIFNRLGGHYNKNTYADMRCIIYRVKTELLLDAEFYFIEKEKPYLNKGIPSPISAARNDLNLLFKNRVKNEVNMTLREYLFENRLTVSAFARQIGYTRVGIQGYLNGTIRLGKKAAYEIEKATRGVVTMEIILEGNPPPEANKSNKNYWK